jgi:hypothetical protein
MSLITDKSMAKRGEKAGESILIQLVVVGAYARAGTIIYYNSGERG